MEFVLFLFGVYSVRVPCIMLSGLLVNQLIDSKVSRTNKLSAEEPLLGLSGDYVPMSWQILQHPLLLYYLKPAASEMAAIKQ
jgi:hypothetical protein